MKGLDTNIILRWLIHDEANVDQSERAAGIVSEGDNHLSAVALSEVIWVLERTYRFKNDEIQSVVAALLDVSTLQVENRVLVGEALAEHARHGGGLNDHIIAAHDRAAGCDYTLTFDRAAARSARFKLV